MEQIKKRVDDLIEKILKDAGEGKIEIERAIFHIERLQRIKEIESEQWHK